MSFTRRLTGVTLLAIVLQATSCWLRGSFFIANLSSRHLQVAYTVPCAPDCPTPWLVGISSLRHGGLSGDLRGNRLARARVAGRVDSLVTFTLDLPPDSAVRIFDGATDFAGNVNAPGAVFWKVSVTVDTGGSARSLEGQPLADAFRKWHKTVHVLELQ